MKGVAKEVRAGLRMLAGWRSKVRWAADVFLQRLPVSCQGPRRNVLRTIHLREGGRLRYRLNRGDLQSIREVWLDQVYRFPAHLGPVRTIVDLGANIGLTSVYLASHLDAQRLVAVEPVPSNADLTRQNLALNGIAGDVVEAVVGPAEGVAYFQAAEQSNVGHVADHGQEVTALNIRTIFDRLGAERIDLLKIDIEGAEEELLSGDRSWLGRVGFVMIEFHTDMVDHERLIAVLEAEGFQHVPATLIYSNSGTGGITEGRT